MTGQVYVPVSEELVRTGRLTCIFPLPVEDLEFRSPDCTVCDGGGNVVYDEGWYCEDCSHLWDKDGRHGEHYDFEADQ